MSYSNTNSNSFTLTHAKYLASKVAADLKRIQRFYGSPSDSQIENFDSEITELLKKGYLEKISYGFKRGEKWIEPTLIYTAEDLSSITVVDDDPGRVAPGADIKGASFASYLNYSSKWHNLSDEEKRLFEDSLPIQRNNATEPGVSGYIKKDNTYTSGSKKLDRSSVKTNK